MKTLKIYRLESTAQGTFGEFELENSRGELLLRGKTCEPAGDPSAESGNNRPIMPASYRARMRYSPKFSPRTQGRKLPILSNELCPESRFILIHAGNYARDTRGCILVGESFMKNPEGIEGVSASQKTLHALLDELNGEDFRVEIY